MKQREILSCIAPDFARDNQDQYIEKKQEKIINYICHYVEKCGAEGMVLGISGGVDSYLAGALGAIAMKKLGKRLRLVMLPNGEQADYKDAQDSITAIKNLYSDLIADSVSINDGYVSVVNSLSNAADFSKDVYTLGNLQPRLRMMYQYALAKNMLVIGTDHSTESITGFFTKFGDGGSDINPIQELIKDDIYLMAEALGAPEAVIKKSPAAGLGISEDDESELGIKYADICAYLKGNLIDVNVAKKLEAIYDRSAHKRALPASPRDEYINKEPTSIVVIGMTSSFIFGELACQNARNALDECVKLINANPQAQVLYVRDMHPKNHCSFQQNGGKWPMHAVRGTEGCEFDSKFYTDIKKTVNTPIARYNVFNKGTDEKKEQYSGIAAQSESFGSLADNLCKNVIVVGMATEYCVLNTVFSILDEECEVTVPARCLAYMNKEEHETALERMKSEGARILF